MRKSEDWLKSAEFFMTNSKTASSLEELNSLTQGALAAAAIGLLALGIERGEE